MEEQLKEIIRYFDERLTNLFLTMGDFQQLFNLAINIPENGRIVEIGSGAGCSLVTMAVASRAKTRGIELISIDSFQRENYYEYGYNITKESALAKFLENMKLWELDVKLLQEHSALACKKIGDKSVDFLFIDGDHRYAGVKADIINYSPKMKDGGILCGHDYRARIHRGVVRAVNEMFSKNIQVFNNSFIWRRK